MNNIIKKFKLFEDSFEDNHLSDFNIDSSEIKDEKEKSNDDLDSHTEYDDLENNVKELLSDLNIDKIKKEIKKEGIDNVSIKGFVNENDIYDFYLENRFDIDNKLVDLDFFNDAPVKYNVESLYDYVITGTKIAVENIILSL